MNTSHADATAARQAQTMASWIHFGITLMIMGGMCMLAWFYGSGIGFAATMLLMLLYKPYRKVEDRLSLAIAKRIVGRKI